MLNSIPLKKGPGGILRGGVGGIVNCPSQLEQGAHQSQMFFLPQKLGDRGAILFDIFVLKRKSQRP